MGVADCGSLVPIVHGVDGLGQLGAACFVDATRVDPRVFISIRASHGAEVVQRCVALPSPGVWLAEVLKGDFFAQPSV